MEEEQGTSTSSALFTAVLVHPHSSLALNGLVKLMESLRGPFSRSITVTVCMHGFHATCPRCPKRGG
jgi:hypothetical protein